MAQSEANLLLRKEHYKQMYLDIKADHPRFHNHRIYQMIATKECISYSTVYAYINEIIKKLSDHDTQPT